MIAPASVPFVDADPRLLRRIVSRLIDDLIVLALTAGLIKALATVLESGSGGVLQLMGTLETDSYWSTAGWQDGDLLTVVTLAASLAFVFGGALAYYAGASLARGRSAGRAITSLMVVRADGSPAPWPLLLGRELLRIVLLAFAVALVWPLKEALATALIELGIRESRFQALYEIVPWIPFVIVVVAWLGATLADPLQRAPHDRLVGTLVVSATPGYAGEDDDFPGRAF